MENAGKYILLVAMIVSTYGLIRFLKDMLINDNYIGEIITSIILGLSMLYSTLRFRLRKQLRYNIFEWNRTYKINLNILKIRRDDDEQ